MADSTAGTPASASFPAESLAWAPNIPVRYADVGGVRMRYIVTGHGPTLVLLHTLRTQLDMFQKVIPALAERYQVYALDYPGHGHSDAPRADYDAELFVGSTSAFLDRLDVRDAVVVGESIGGTIALLLAARHHARVRAVVAINPYDYDGGRGLRRSSTLANVAMVLTGVPVLGEIVARAAFYDLEKRIFEGGVYRKESFPPGLLHELHRSGKRPGHARAFASLVRHWSSWAKAPAEYGNIDVPVLLMYGEHDWSHPDEREADRRALPRARAVEVPDAGHFLALDAPQEVIRALDTLDTAARRRP